MRMNTIDDDDDYDWVDPKERNYKPTKPGPLPCLNRNEKAAILAGVIVVIIVSTVVITRAITEPLCKEGWIEIANKSCFKFLPSSCEEGCSFEKAKDICQRKGGKLAEPREPNALKEIIEMARDSRKLSSHNFWVGLGFDPAKGQFQWLSDMTEATLADNLWYNGHPSYAGSHVHLLMGDMLLNDVGEGEAYKPICQREKKGVCAKGWKSPGGHSAFCYNFMENDCQDGCTQNDAKQVCEDNESYLAEGPDFEFLTNFAKLLKQDVNWRIGINYNHSADIFVRVSNGDEVDLSNVYRKHEPNKESVEMTTDTEEDAWYPDVDSKYEYDYPEDLHDLFDNIGEIVDEEEKGTSCMELRYNDGWKVKEGNCHRKKSKDLNIQPLCQL